jgi:hypothetical protein
MKLGGFIAGIDPDDRTSRQFEAFHVEYPDNFSMRGSFCTEIM